MAKATIKDVAREAGVGLGTASRALTSSGPISSDTRERVLAAARRLDYHPNSQAQSLRSARTQTVGLLIPDVRNPFFAELAHSFEQESLAGGFTTFLGNANEDTVQQNRYLDSLRSHRVDGLALAPQGGATEAIEALLEDGVPAVFVDRTVEGITIPSVTSDPRPGIHQVAEHLSGLGHRRVGYISGPQQVSSGRERLRAWEDAVAEFRLDADPRLVLHGDFQQTSGEIAAVELIERGATALFAADSPMALGALDACQARHLRIGHDIDLVGFDDLRLFRLLDPSLTTVSQDVAGMGRIAAQLLQRVIAGESPEPVRLPTRLVTRSSTHPLASETGATA
ncbi:LacI family DNA-binding transcriptional regulator [Luteococcus sp. OSA5]|uniref:LacI family DNA-binding transcriptional regulator n=1 Tax=Luteococcus sp. OSA5 TaxID=3401630 RepID=UPI003B42B482